MKKIDALKELMKINFNKLVNKLWIDDLVIGFKNDEFIVIYKNEVVLKDKVLSYDFTYRSQEKFIRDVVKFITPVAMNLNELRIPEEYYLEKYLNTEDKNYYTDILGQGKIYFPHKEIGIFLKKVFSIDDKHICKICVDFKDWELYYIINEIKEKINKNNIRIVLYSDMKSCVFKFHIDGVMREVDFCLGFIDDPDDLYKPYKSKKIIVDNIRTVMEYNVFKLYYKTATKEEIEEAAKVVENIVEKYLKKYEEYLKDEKVFEMIINGNFR